MREMVLNHASLASPDRQTVVGWLKGIATGMAPLVDNKVTLFKPEDELSRKRDQLSA